MYVVLIYVVLIYVLCSDMLSDTCFDSYDVLIMLFDEAGVLIYVSVCMCIVDINAYIYIDIAAYIDICSDMLSDICSDMYVMMF